MTYPYTSEKPPLPRSVEELRAAIPGWGVDLDPADRPAVPKLQARPGLGGGDPEPPERQTERQTERWPRERSIEHAMLTPVFGTACPPKGLSGLIRRLAYARYSEARSAHWLLLLGADRVDMLESTLGSLLTRRPDNLLAETGIRSELTHQGISSRVGRRRADLVHQPLDPVIVLGPWVLAGYGAVSAVRRVARLRRTR
jgi:hypothetical protein